MKANPFYFENISVGKHANTIIIIGIPKKKNELNIIFKILIIIVKIKAISKDISKSLILRHKRVKFGIKIANKNIVINNKVVIQKAIQFINRPIIVKQTKPTIINILIKTAHQNPALVVFPLKLT